jgi:hypothetical protein
MIASVRGNVKYLYVNFSLPAWQNQYHDATHRAILLNATSVISKYDYSENDGM